MRKETVLVTLSACVTIVATGALVAGAGPLDPPGGPVEPTYKTLDQVQPRILINNENTPGNETALYRITQPGSYYLDRNVIGLGARHGIEIAASDVTVDLMGFKLSGVPNSLDGITTAAGGRQNITIRNGTIRAWGQNGICLDDESSSVHIEDIHASNNGRDGIEVTGAAVIRDCTAGENGMDGIWARRSTLTGCVASGNMDNGFTLTDCSITGSTATSNGEDGISVLGSVVSNCTSTDNVGQGIVATHARVSDCTASNNDSSGIEGVFGAAIEACYVYLNNGNGIAVGSDCSVRNNTCDSNDGAGIFAGADDSRIEGNTVYENALGFDINGTRNIVIRNHARANGQNYAQIEPGNIKGAIVGDQNAMNAAENDLVNFSF